MPWRRFFCLSNLSWRSAGGMTLAGLSSVRSTLALRSLRARVWLSNNIRLSMLSSAVVGSLFNIEFKEATKADSSVPPGTKEVQKANLENVLTSLASKQAHDLRGQPDGQSPCFESCSAFDGRHGGLSGLCSCQGEALGDAAITLASMIDLLLFMPRGLRIRQSLCAMRRQAELRAKAGKHQLQLSQAGKQSGKTSFKSESATAVTHR